MASTEQDRQRWREYRRTHKAECLVYAQQYRANRSPEQTARHHLLTKQWCAKRQAFLAGYKRVQGCSVCGYNAHAAALHLHHVDPTTKEVRQWNMLPWNRLLAELEKCVVLCANCHELVHSTPREAECA